MPFAKGHGTGNDFVIVPDPDGRLALSAAQVAALCDRRRGIGGDGLLRVVRTVHVADVVAEAPGPGGAGGASGSSGADGSADPEWFMDYRNADGSLAEMCGNGARVFARYLIETGLASGPRVEFLTRAGVVTATVGASDVSVTMPPVVIGGPGVVRVAGMELKGTTATCGNPNLVCSVSTVDDLDLRDPPVLDPDQFPAGANVEFVVPVVAGHVRMRVVERGVGETLSCGSGACAVAGVVLNGGSGTVIVDVPGGRLTVAIGDDGSCVLTGPAVLVATGTVALPADGMS
ncbi:MAG: diaminopimelate epimerase [Micromonosporaceae bacterium]|nr:diaminopimelate epimerase [Micromonosporaceae bacterium]